MRNEATPTTALRDVRRLLRAGTVAGLTDGQLLARFVGHGGEASEAAFAALVDRHGAMVWGVCRRILRDDHGAEDAFQATFLILVRKAATVRADDSLGRWLYGVSRKVAARARSDSWRRRTREDPRVETVAAPGQDPGRAELLAVLDEEIGRLPERYRAAVVLCDLDGLSHEEAARQLGCAIGTIGSRLARGRHRLRERVARRGLAPCGGLLLAAESAGAAVPPRLAAATVRAATSSVSMPSIASGLVSAAITTLVEGVTKSMIATRLKWIVFASMTLGVVAGGSYVRAIQESAPVEKVVQVEKLDPRGGEPTVNDGEAIRADTDQRRNLRPRSDWITGFTPQSTSKGAAFKSAPYEIAQIEFELAKKKLTLAKWEAQLQLAKAVVANNIRLNQRRPGMVSEPAMAKNEAELRVTTAEFDIAQLDVRECETRLAQARSAKDDPVRWRKIPETPRAIELPESLERRLEAIERKLDRILDRMGGGQDPASPSRGSREAR